MVYGFNTHSFLNSTEHRQMKKERAALTAKTEAERATSPPQEILIPVCTCRSFRFAHDPSRHKELRSDMDWRLPTERAHQQLFWKDDAR